IEEGTERVVEEVQQEVAVAEERIEEGTERVVEGAKQEVAAARRPWYQSKRWGSVLLVVLAAFLVLFGLLAWWVASHPILAIDVMITRDFQESQAPWLRITMIAVSYIGNMPVLSALFVVLVGPSRVYLGDHWASDVLGSYLLSGFLLGVTLWIYLYLKGRNALALRGHMAERLRKYMRR